MIRLSHTQCYLPPSSMSLTRSVTVDRHYDPLRQNQYHSKVHTPPDKRGASAKGKPPSYNQQSPQVSQYNKNGINTPLSDSSNSSIAAAILWPLLIKNMALFSLKN